MQDTPGPPASDSEFPSVIDLTASDSDSKLPSVSDIELESDSDSKLPYHPHTAGVPPGPPPGLGLGERMLDRFIDPLRPGEILHMDSTTSFVLDVTYRTVVEALMTRPGDVVYVDGCCRVNPYEVVRLCKRYAFPVRGALERLHVARGFTAYQMSTIIDEQLRERMEGASLLVVSGIQYLYQDTDVPYDEARVLLERVVEHVRDLSEAFSVPALVTDLVRGGGRDMREIVTEYCPRRVSFTACRRGRRRWIRILDHTTGRTEEYRPVPLAQALLDEYIPRTDMVPDAYTSGPGLMYASHGGIPAGIQGAR